MAHTTTRSTTSASKSAGPAQEDNQERAAAAESADLQTHHLWLYCLEQSRRAQARMTREFAEDMAEASRKLVASRELRDWLNAQAEFFSKSVAHGFAAHRDALTAWADLQAAVSKDLRANASALPWTWAPGSTADEAARGNGAATGSIANPWAGAWHLLGNACMAALPPGQGLTAPPLAPDAWLDTTRANAQRMVTAWIEATRAAAQAG